ncbi:sensor histidine kinase [Aliivibrio sp. 1S128]|uniref:sensor histidine kinase n=1 Tax=Aliivibrio sp. 1S128 TaxID=1840085 RepID=UPI00080DB39A|nr:histidine kinase [Aliivibrio sp. 1S128]OCH23796.1 ATPase [Aliivibrio sp. 1S128]
MVTINKQKEPTFRLLKSFSITTVFCIIIAMVTSNLWPSPFYEHIIISLGYGYSAILSAYILDKLFPMIRKVYSSAIAMVFTVIFGTLHAFIWLKKYDDFSTIEALKPVVLLGLIFSIICFYYFHTNEQKLLAEQELEVAKRKQSEQEKALVLSQLSQLQSQIEPHFLFNTLANISALIELDNNKAKLMLEKLTDLLRGTLKTSRKPLISLEQETELLSAYLAIQQIRLGERLNYDIDNPLIDSLSLPPLLIQPLVENAITHSIEPKASGGQVKVKFKQLDGIFKVTISNNGLGLNSTCSTAGNGMSLNNIKQRLQDLFEGKASLTITENKQGGVTTELSIPMECLEQLNKEYS